MSRSEKLGAALEMLDFKLNKNNKKDLNIANIQIHHKLMNKLESVIESQRQLVQELEIKVNQQIIILQKDRAQNSALSVLVKRYHYQERATLENNEQKELDNQILAMLHNDVMP